MARPALSGTPIRELQNALIGVGVMKQSANGLFGPHTKEALRRFQWYLSNLRNRLKVPPGSPPSTGVISSYVATSATAVSGVCDAALGKELATWLAGNFVTTSPLVRLNLDGVSNVDTADTFEVLSYPSAKDGEVLVHEDFADVISDTMNNAAKNNKVSLRINQTFRVHDIPPSGAVVPPASKSQHLIGHAVDLNIVDGTTVNTSPMFKDGTETDNADKFIDAVKSGGLRWGGDFGVTDPPHFDDFLNPNGEDYEMNFFFAQHCFDKEHPMRVAR
jgi:hypothetical protein